MRTDSPGPPEVRDTDAFVRKYADLVYSIARRLCRSEEEAGELFQEAFVRLLRGLPSFEGRASLKTWVCQVVINADRNRRRWWSRFRRNLPEAHLLDADRDREAVEAIEPQDGSAGPERLLLGREIRDRVEKGLAALPADQRLAVVLRDVEGLDYEEIGRAMNIPVGTVKSKISRGRAALREELSDLVDPGERVAIR